MHNCSQWNFQYLRSPMGAVKVINVGIGAISLVLVGVAYVPIWTLDVFLGTVTTCLALSLLYMLFYLVAGSGAIQCKANRITSFIFHALAGTALIVAGIELIGWSEYNDPSCKFECPRLYTVGIAKTLTFMNGTLYLIVGFLGIKDDDLLDPDSADEDIPLLSSTTVPTSFPSSISGGKQTLMRSQSNTSYHHNNSQQYYYDNFFRFPSKYHYACSPHEDARSSLASSYHSSNPKYFPVHHTHPPPPPNHIITAEYASNNSAIDTTTVTGTNNSKHGIHSYNHSHNGGRRSRNSSLSGNPVSTSATSAQSANDENNLRLIQELKHCDVSDNDA